jgi:hypothetical protein
MIALLGLEGQTWNRGWQLHEWKLNRAVHSGRNKVRSWHVFGLTGGRHSFSLSSSRQLSSARYAELSLSSGMSRRFPPPWSVEEYNDTCFIVRDHNGQQLA